MAAFLSLLAISDLGLFQGSTGNISFWDASLLPVWSCHFLTSISVNYLSMKKWYSLPLGKPIFPICIWLAKILLWNYFKYDLQMSLGFIDMIGITRCLNMTISCIYCMHIWCLLAAGKLELAYHLNCTQRIMLPNIFLSFLFHCVFPRLIPALKLLVTIIWWKSMINI